jgi:arylsulfatase
MSQKQPHLILIMTDQQRTDTIGAWGCDHMVTPHMDRLAAEGLSFPNTFCPGATCVASRAAMFTGMYPHNTGVYSFDDWAHHRTWVEDLADAGYWCVNMGKMHLGPWRAPGGFHERIVVENPTNGYLRSGGGDDDWGRYLSMHGTDRPNDRHLTDPDWRKKCQGAAWHLDEHLHGDVYIADAAVSWISSHQGDKPLFLQVGFTGPHEPWDPLPRHLEMYEDRAMPVPVGRDGELAEKPPQQEAHKRRLAEALAHHESGIDMYAADEADIERMRRHYYAKVTTVDEQLGKVMAALEARGYLENSLLVFCSDHGEMLGDHSLAYKWLMYDQITNVPMIVCDRRVDRPTGNQDRDQLRATTDLASLMDIGPTLLEAAGLEVPTRLEGRSLQPALDDAETQPREFVYCEDNYQIMLRSQTHKLVYYIGQTEGELYDLTSDPDELYNLWGQAGHEAQQRRLLDQVLLWLAASNYYNAGYKQQGPATYRRNWPTADTPSLTGPPVPERPIDL